MMLTRHASELLVTTHTCNQVDMQCAPGALTFFAKSINYRAQNYLHIFRIRL